MTSRKHTEFGCLGKEPTSDTQFIWKEEDRLCLHQNFAGGMKNLMIKDINKTQNELDFQ